MEKVYVVADMYAGSMKDYEGTDCWTLSEDPKETGWETDSGYPGYGLPKEKAEFYAKCINYCIEHGVKFEEECEQVKTYYKPEHYCRYFIVYMSKESNERMLLGDVSKAYFERQTEGDIEINVQASRVILTNTPHCWVKPAE